MHRELAAAGRRGEEVQVVLVSSGNDGMVRVWDAVTGEPAGELLTGHGGWGPVAAGRAGDRDVIVSGGNDGMVRVWDAVTGQPVDSSGSTYVHRRVAGPSATAAVAVGRAGDRDIILAGDEHGTVWILDAVTAKPEPGPLAGHDGEVTAVAVGQAGDYDVIVSGGADRAVLVRARQAHNLG